jgi:hypothetical protein
MEPQENMLWLLCRSATTSDKDAGFYRNRFKKQQETITAVRVSSYPETALFKALPRLCISSPMPRIVAHPSKAETTKSNAERNNVFFFILPPRP